MKKLKVDPAAPPLPNTDWFRATDSGVVYKRGKNGLCIDSSGHITAMNYDGLSVFDDTKTYEPLYPGTVITITL
jgi:hypothetical protein